MAIYNTIFYKPLANKNSLNYLHTLRCMRIELTLPYNTTMPNKSACICCQIFICSWVIHNILQPQRTNITLVNQYNHSTVSMQGSSSTFSHLTIIWCPSRETKHNLTKITLRISHCMKTNQISRNNNANTISKVILHHF